MAKLACLASSSGFEFVYQTVLNICMLQNSNKVNIKDLIFYPTVF